MTGPAGGLVLALNAGSSSLKFGLFGAAGAMPAMLRGEIEDLSGRPRLRAADGTGVAVADRLWPADAAPGFPQLLDAVLELADTVRADRRLVGVGHRIVHGGADFHAPARVTPALLAALEALIPLDPLHMPHCLAPVRILAQTRPDLAQAVAFDTAFHHTLPAVATWMTLPRALRAEGLRRYGFHGLSYEFIARRLRQDAPELARGRVIVAHLGAGASLCALRDGRSIATTMGFSTLDGLMMATRCGHVDPGAILYLGRKGRSFDEIETLLYDASGLLGVSEISGDMRTLLASDDPRAREALDLFSYRIATEAGGLVSALGGLDGLVFTAGVGAHAPAIRAAACGRLAWLGLTLDPAANQAGRDRISGPDSAIDVRVIATDEEAMIARHAAETLA